MKTTTIFTSALLLASSALNAQGPSPVEMRMREQLKALTLRVNAAETAQAALQVEKTELEGKVKKLEKSFEDVTKQMNADKDLAKEEAEKLRAEIAAQAKQTAETKDLLVKSRKFGEQADALARKTEAERAKLAQETIVLKRVVSDQRMKNSGMLATTKEILERYSKFGLGTALTAREPFVGITRARLESYIENYDSELAKYRIRLDAIPPKAAATPPANDRPADSKPAEKSSAGKKPEPKS